MHIRVITNLDKTGNDLHAITTLVGADWGPLELWEAIAWAKTPGNQFVIQGAMSTVEVMVMPPDTVNGHEYLRTRAENVKIDPLLELPEIVKLENLLGGRSI